MNRNRLGRLACVLGILCAVLAQAAPVRAEDKRSLPFNKQSVYSYFRQVEEGRRGLPEDLPPDALQAKFCQLYVSVLKQSGYDFETTIQNAVQFADRGNGKLDDPRFLFWPGCSRCIRTCFCAWGSSPRTPGTPS